MKESELTRLRRENSELRQMLAAWVKDCQWDSGEIMLCPDHAEPAQKWLDEHPETTTPPRPK